MDKSGHVGYVRGASKALVTQGKDRDEKTLRVIVRYIDENKQPSEIEGFVKSTTSTVAIRSNVFQSLEKISASAARSATVSIEFPTAERTN
ncbi:MAG: hypothetical protein ACYCSO_09805 [Cuniculiplasma sp.]